MFSFHRLHHGIAAIVGFEDKRPRIAHRNQMGILSLANMLRHSPSSPQNEDAPRGRNGHDLPEKSLTGRPAAHLGAERIVRVPTGGTARTASLGAASGG